MYILNPYLDKTFFTYIIYVSFGFWFGLEVNGPVDTIKVMSSRSVYITTLSGQA